MGWGCPAPTPRDRGVARADGAAGVEHSPPGRRAPLCLRGVRAPGMASPRCPRYPPVEGSSLFPDAGHRWGHSGRAPWLLSAWCDLPGDVRPVVIDGGGATTPTLAGMAGCTDVARPSTHAPSAAPAAAGSHPQWGRGLGGAWRYRQGRPWVGRRHPQHAAATAVSAAAAAVAGESPALVPVRPGVETVVWRWCLFGVPREGLDGHAAAAVWALWEGETAGRLGSGLSTARGRGLPPGWVQPCTCAGSRARRNKNHNCPPAPSLRVGRRRRRCALWHSRAARWPTGASADACPVGHARAAEPLLGGRCGTLRGHRLWRQRRPRWQPCQPCPPRWQFQQGVRSAMMCHGTAHPPRHSHTLPDSKPWS